MKKPADILVQLSAYLDGELSEEESAGIREKLIENKQWRSHLEDLRELNLLLTLWDNLDTRGIKASSGFESGLIERLRSLRRKRNVRGKPSATR